jgi:D-amino-acid dehydrogenase
VTDVPELEPAEQEHDNVSDTGDVSDRAGSTNADTVVIGGGIVGICTARYLQRTGRAVSLVEPGSPGAGASGHNGGVFNFGECVPIGTPDVIKAVPRMLVDPMSPLVIRWRYLPRLAPWLTRFILASRAKRVEEISIALHRLTDSAMGGYAPLLEGSAADALVSDGGVLYAYQTDESFDGARFTMDLRNRRGTKIDILDDSGISALDPVLTGRFRHAMHSVTARFTLDPERFTHALAEDFIRDGGAIHAATAHGFERHNGRVEAVTTSAGSIRTESVVIAAGAWSTRFTRQLGFDVPLEAERGYGVHIEDPGISFRLPTIVSDLHLAFRPTPTGTQIAGVDELASADAPARPELTKRLVQGAEEVFPELRTDRMTWWMHCRPSMPDSLPVIGRVPGVSNAFMAFGHGHKGLCLGAITGKLVQQLMDGEAMSVDLEPYRPTRFSIRRRWGRVSTRGG